jgi:outer membrane murein-binding lipoprotein Lpp
MSNVARLATLLLVLAGLLLAGCGADVKKDNEYVDAVNKAQNEFASTFDRLNAKITATSSPAEDRATLQRFKVAIDQVVKDLRAVQPPSKVTALHRELIGEISSYGVEIRKARKAFASDDPAKVIDAQTQLVTAVTTVSSRINSTIDQINKKLRE